MGLDNIDKKLLNIIQAEFPLSREPFHALGLRLNTGSDEIIRRIRQLKTEGIIRYIGPVFNPERLGYRTTLVAMKLQAERLNEAGQIIGTHPLVSHCYERDHDFNLWFTLAMPITDDIENEVHNLGKKVKAETTLNLPAVRVFKIGAFFNLRKAKSHLPSQVILPPAIANPSSEERGNINTYSNLSSIDRSVINELQQDLPLTEKPFDPISAKAGVNADEFLSHCQSLLQRGIMRRFSVSVRHNKLGFTANAMACWKAPSDMVEAAGKKIAAFPEVSHCYERHISAIWSYNLFAMIHASTEKTCRAIAAKICSETGLDIKELILLFSTKEIKKTRLRYTV